MKKSRRTHSAEFQAKVAVCAIRGDKPLSVLAEQFEIHPNQVLEIRQYALKHMVKLFRAESKTTSPPSPPECERRELYAKIGQLTLEIDALQSALCREVLLNAKR